MQNIKTNKSAFTRGANSLGILKRCYIDSGKTKLLVGQVEEELEEFYNTRNSMLESYKAKHIQWEYEVQQERTAKERQIQEKIRSNALSRANELLLLKAWILAIVFFLPVSCKSVFINLSRNKSLQHRSGTSYLRWTRR